MKGKSIAPTVGHGINEDTHYPKRNSQRSFVVSGTRTSRLGMDSSSSIIGSNTTTTTNTHNWDIDGEESTIHQLPLIVDHMRDSSRNINDSAKQSHLTKSLKLLLIRKK